MSNNIRISRLNSDTVVKSADFFPLVESSSLTTYKVTVSNLNVWWAASGSALSSSYSITSSYAASASISKRALTASYLDTTTTASFSVSASYAKSASRADTASYFNFSLPNNIPPFASASFSSSWASSSFSATSASWSSASLSASYARSASVAGSSSYSLSGSFSVNSTSASYAKSASRADTSSFALNSISPIKAFGTFYMIGIDDLIPYSGSFNFISGAYKGNDVPQAPGTTKMGTSSLLFIPTVGQHSFGTSANFKTWILYMQNPLPSVNYTVIATMGGEQEHEYGFLVNFPNANRTTTAFSMSLSNLGNFDFTTGTENNWFQIMVLHI